MGLWKLFKLQPTTNVLALSKSATFFIALASDNQLCDHDPEAPSAAEALPKKGSARNIVNELYFNKNFKNKIKLNNKKGSVQCYLLLGPRIFYFILIL